MLKLGAEARANKAPSNTPYRLDGSDGRESHGENCVNISAPPGNVVISNDPNESFASELNKVPTGNVSAAQNLLHKAMHAAKTTKDKEAVEATWKEFVKSYGARRA
jgi:hypothetical protein